MGSFVELQTPEGQRTVTLSGERCTVGRSPANDIRNTDDRTLSAVHAVLERVGGIWSVRDLDSSNGTFVNGQRVLGGRPLTDGDEIRLGATHLIFHDEARRPMTQTEPTQAPPSLTDTERKVLVALCAPKLEGSILASPASTDDIAERCGISNNAAEDMLHSLCESFGISADVDQPRQRLAEEAIHRGAVGPEDLREGPSPATFRRDKDTWTLSFGDVTFRLKDMKGLRYLYVLLSNPGREIFVTDLVARAEHPADAGKAGRAIPEVASGTLGVSGGEKGIPILDEAAKESYRTRVEDLRERIREGEAFGDPERIAKAKAELEAVTEELSKAVGLGGRDRRTSSKIERSRVNVTRAIRSAIEKIQGFSPQLAEHLDASVATGRFCAYEPDEAPDWAL